MSRTWEEYLFNEHQAVAVSPWNGATGLQLFDLMVRRNDHYFKTGQAGLRQIGSFFGFELRKGEPVENLQPVDKLKEALQKFKHQLKTTVTTWTDDEDEDPIISRETLPSLRQTVSASSKNLASVLEYANVDNSSSKALTCTLDDVRLHRVDREALRAAIEAWKPNMASLTKYTSPSLFRGLVDLFLITDILYAGHVIVEDVTSRSIGAGVDAGLAGLALGLDGGAKVGTKRSNGSKKELTGDHIPFAIRVVRLRYNSKGELQRAVVGVEACAFGSVSRGEVSCYSDIEVQVVCGPSGGEYPLSGGVNGPAGVVDVGELYASETIEVGEGDATGIVRVVEGDDASGMVEVGHAHVSRMVVVVEGDAPERSCLTNGSCRGTRTGRVVGESQVVVVDAANGAAAEQDESDEEEEDESDEEENALTWFKNYDPLHEYKCEMSDFFGDDLSDLAGDGSVIQLDIDIAADDSDAASESATLHTEVSEVEMARTWEEYLFNEHQAVAVSPWNGATGLQLFDLMVRRNDHYFKTGQAALHHIGSFFGLGLRKGEDVENLQPVDKLKEALQKFKHQLKTPVMTWTDDEDEDPLIRRETLPPLTETVSASSKNLAAVLEYANIDNSSKALTCTLEDVRLHCVDREALRAAIDAWKPNMASLTKYTSPSLFRGLVDLFLITDILYAGHVTVENVTSRSIGAGLAGQVLGLDGGAKVGSERSNGSKKELTGGHIPFAIRVVCLRYNSKGELHRVHPEVLCYSGRAEEHSFSDIEEHIESDEEEVARAEAEENASWFMSNYDPLSEYKCEMGDFFGDDLSDLAGDVSVIQLDIDIEADDLDAASESATLHTNINS